MAFFQCNIYSEALQQGTNVNVILPLPDSANLFFGAETRLPTKGQKYQTLWLLHGGTADYSDWCRFSRIEGYAQEKQLAVVMPNLGDSYYCNVPHVGRFYDYYTSELPTLMRAIYPLAEDRENNFIGGLSMGGFGAFQAALRNPQNYAAAFSLSGGLNFKDQEIDHIELTQWDHDVRAAIFGEDGRYYDPHAHHMPTMVDDLVASGQPQPRFYSACGTEDDIVYAPNLRVTKYMQESGLDVFYEEGPGIHNWDFWDPYLKRALDWLPAAGGFV